MTDKTTTESERHIRVTGTYAVREQLPNRSKSKLVWSGSYRFNNSADMALGPLMMAVMHPVLEMACAIYPAEYIQSELKTLADYIGNLEVVPDEAESDGEGPEPGEEPQGGESN